MKAHETWSAAAEPQEECPPCGTDISNIIFPCKKSGRKERTLNQTAYNIMCEKEGRQEYVGSGSPKITSKVHFATFPAGQNNKLLLSAIIAVACYILLYMLKPSFLVFKKGETLQFDNIYAAALSIGLGAIILLFF